MNDQDVQRAGSPTADLLRSVRELTSDVLGIIIIGLSFLIGISISLIFPSLVFIHAIAPAVGTLFYDFRDWIRGPPAPGLITILLLSYVIGTLFWRKDPNLPDSYSFHRLPEERQKESPAYVDPPGGKATYREDYEKAKRNEEHLDAWIYSQIFNLFNKRTPNILDRLFPSSTATQRLKQLSFWIAKQLPWRSGYFVDFPYLRLRDYLEKRGLTHLSAMIPWTTNNNVNLHTRSFINALKIRINLTSPAKYSIISKNEAEVRLFSALWYCLRPIWFAAFIGF